MKFSNPTFAEENYDNCFTNFQEFPSDSNEQALILAEGSLKKERKHLRDAHTRAIASLNREQGRSTHKQSIDTTLLHWCLMAFSGLLLGMWLWAVIKQYLPR